MRKIFLALLVIFAFWACQKEEAVKPSSNNTPKVEVNPNKPTDNAGNLLNRHLQMYCSQKLILLMVQLLAIKSLVMNLLNPD